MEKMWLNRLTRFQINTDKQLSFKDHLRLLEQNQLFGVNLRREAACIHICRQWPNVNHQITVFFYRFLNPRVREFTVVGPMEVWFSSMTDLPIEGQNVGNSRLPRKERTSGFSPSCKISESTRTTGFLEDWMAPRTASTAACSAVVSLGRVRRRGLSSADVATGLCTMSTGT
jgi:hypothetical protein